MEILLKDKQEYKIELMDKLFALGGNQDKKALGFLREHMEDFFRNYRCFDIQISNAMTLIKLQLENFGDYQEFIRSVEFAEQACLRLLHEGPNDFYDVQLAAPFMYYTRDFEEAKMLADVALKKLEEYKKENRYDQIKRAIHANMLTRILMQMYSEDVIYLNEDALFNPELVFRQHYDVALDYCEKNGLEAPKAAYRIRRGCFFKDKELILENLSWLRINETMIYEAMLSELKTYGLNPDNLDWKEE